MARIRTGIEITPGHILAANVRVWRGGWSLLASATMTRTGKDEALGADEASALESLLFRKGFAPAPCVVSAPDAALRWATLPLPPLASGAPIDQLARAEFARHHKIDPGQFELSIWPLPGTGSGAQVMALGCDTEPTERRVAALESAGLCVVGVDDSARALARVVARQPWPSSVRVGTRLDPWGATVVVLHEGVLLYARKRDGLGLAGDRSADSVEAAHALAREIDACVGFARHRCRAHAPVSIGLFGMAGEQASARELLTSRFSRSMAEVRCADGSAFDVRYGAAIGLALLEDLP